MTGKPTWSYEISRISLSKGTAQWLLEKTIFVSRISSVCISYFEVIHVRMVVRKCATQKSIFFSFLIYFLTGVLKIMKFFIATSDNYSCEGGVSSQKHLPYIPLNVRSLHYFYVHQCDERQRHFVNFIAIRAVNDLMHHKNFVSYFPKVTWMHRISPLKWCAKTFKFTKSIWWFKIHTHTNAYPRSFPSAWWCQVPEIRN